jgi:hypothetical protein
MADLPGSYLGFAYSDLVLIDADAAGHGWFVDATPGSDEEYGLLADGRLAALADSAAAGRVDLLSVLAHELGHVLGLDDLDEALHPSNVMADELASGIRRAPTTDDVDALFASGDWE